MNLAMDVEVVAERALKAKQLWLDWAEIVDAWRIFPRAVLAAVLKLTISGSTTLYFWFIHLPSSERHAADAVAVTSIITVLTTLLGVTTAFYVTNGRKWQSGS